MGLTYVSTQMIEKPVVFTELSATNLLTQKLTADNAFIKNISLQQVTANDVFFQGTVITNFTATNIALSSYIFTNSDNSKVFHFDTTTQPVITAIFQNNNINNGFNVGIVNTGTGLIVLSSNFVPTINATNTFNSVQHSGIFVYKINNQLFGIGVFE
jgi:hypothetical protein